MVNGCVRWMFYQTKKSRCVCNDAVWRTLLSSARVPHCRWYLEGRGKSQSRHRWNQALPHLAREIFRGEQDDLGGIRSTTILPRSGSDTGSLNSQDQAQDWPRDILSVPFAEIDRLQAGCPPSHQLCIGNMESTGWAAGRMSFRSYRINTGQPAPCLFWRGTAQQHIDNILW